MPTISFNPRLARQLPDPFYHTTHGTERHMFFVEIPEVPTGISLGPSPRSTQTRWDVYKEAQASLLDKDCTPGTFHLKNRGITIVAKAVRRIEENVYEVDFADNHGVIDGVHTYKMILEALKNKDIDIPRKQYVKIEILTNVPDEWLPEISAGLNTAIQMQSDRLLHLQKALRWIKEELKDQEYYKAISWAENERGAYDARELLCVLTCFNTTSYPNAGSVHPVAAYDSKSIVLGSFETEHTQHNGKSYRRLRPIIKDILRLHDTIQLEFPKFCALAERDASGLIEEARAAPHKFLFLNTRSTERLARGALFPILAAFRWMVEDDPDSGEVRWRGGFKNVVERWRAAGERMVIQTVEKSVEVGQNPDAIGKSASHWGALHKEIAFMDLMAKQAATPDAAQSGGT